MFKVIILFLSLFTCNAFAQQTPDQRCDRQAVKGKQEACYLQLVQERKEALEEFGEAISDSTSIPLSVKAEVLKDYQSFMRNISRMCPDNACVASAMMYQIRDMYQATSKFTTPR